MTNRNIKPKPTPADEARVEAEQEADLQRRLAVAGLDGDEEPEDMDEFRHRLTREISMILNEWHGCPQRLCRRNGGCMAPEGLCSNVEYEPMTREEWEPVRVEVRRALDEMIADGRLVID